MSKHRVVVLKVVAGQLSVVEAAQRYGFSRRHLHRLLARYRAEGLDAVEPRSRRPRSNSRATAPEAIARIIALRGELLRDGSDAGPATIRWHLDREGLPAPSLATIHRILTRAGLVTAEPRKRPRSSYVRFEAALPNETWQSDFTHWRLVDGTDVEVLNWLDDHSRYLLSCTVHRPVTGDAVVKSFLACTEIHGIPVSTLTDNGSVYTSRFTGGRNTFELILPLLGTRQKNGSPAHPQTQGKIERFHQTLKRFLAAQPTADTLSALQQQLDTFRHHYNEQRPHRARAQRTPGEAYRALPKALPDSTRPAEHYRLRYDRVDQDGKISLRHAGRLHHLGIGRAHNGAKVLAIADDNTITVTRLDTGEVLSEHHIDTRRNYWRNQLRSTPPK